MRPIGDTGKYINGVAFKPTDWSAEGLPIVRIQNLTDPSKPMNRTTRDVDPVYVVHPGDLLVSWSATLDAFIWDREPALLNQHIFKVVPNTDLVSKKYLFFALRQAIVEMARTEHLHGSTMKHINRGPFLAHQIRVPSPREQSDIVAEIETQFSRLDEAVANLQRVKASLKRLRAAVLKGAVEGRLVSYEAEIACREGRPYESAGDLLDRVANARRANWSARGKFSEASSADTTGLAALPEGWVWASTEQLSDFITKGTTPSASKLSDGPGDVQFLKVYNLTFDGSLNHRYKPAFVSHETHNDELARSKVRPGDVLINIVGPPLGQVSVVPAHLPEANINQAIARIRVVEPVNARFVALALMCDDIMRWAIRRSKTTVGQTNLTLELCRALPLPLPPLAEQHRIVAEVDRRLSIVREVETEVDANLKRAQGLRQAVLAKAFTPGSAPTLGMADSPQHISLGA
jgi:type I restriction enzyme S subunit